MEKFQFNKAHNGEQIDYNKCIIAFFCFIFYTIKALTTTNVIIIFQTMDNASLASKTIHSSKAAKARPQVNLKSNLQYVDFQFREQQQLSIQSKLPKGFFLINPFNGDLEKIRSQYKSAFIEKDLAANKHNSAKNKKQQKRLELKQKFSTKTQQPKGAPKEEEKSAQVQKTKKIKKELKTYVRRVFKSRNQNGHQMQQNQSINGLEGQLENRELVQKKEQDGGRKQKDIKQKKKARETHIEKQPIIYQELSHADTLRQPQKNKIIEEPMVNEVAMSQEMYISDKLIPLLQNNALRYDPKSQQGQISGTLEQNNFRFLFGLPYTGPMSETVSKLDQKQKKFCNNIIQRLKVHRSSQAFRVRVDPEAQGVPDYHSVVYTPMDLRTIEKKIHKDRYRSITEFHCDINTIFLNSYKYNLRETVYFKATVEFEDYYQQLLKQARKNPAEYLKEFITKTTKPRNEEDELDYTEHAPKKTRKRPESFKIPNMTKSQIMDKQRKKLKLGRNKSMFDDQSLIVSQSMAMDTFNQFNGEFSNMINEEVMGRKENNEQRTRLRRVNSFQVAEKEIHGVKKEEKLAESVDHGEKGQKMEKYQLESKTRKTIKREPQPEYEKKKTFFKPVQSKKQNKNKGKVSTWVCNDDYNDDDNDIGDNFQCGEAELKIETKSDRIQFQFVQQAQKIDEIAVKLEPQDIKKENEEMLMQEQIRPIPSLKQAIKQQQKELPEEHPNPTLTTINKDSIKILTNDPKPHTVEHSIIVNNLNTHPEAMSCMGGNIFHPTVDIYTQNSSGAAMTCVSTPLEIQGKGHPAVPKSKKAKAKAKAVDEEYRCSSDDDYVVENPRSYGRRRDRKIAKPKRADSSQSGDHALPVQKKRGRQPKKLLAEKNLLQQNAQKNIPKPQEIPNPQPFSQQHQFPQALLQNYIPLSNELGQDHMHNSDSIFMENSQDQDSNPVGINFYNNPHLQ